MSRSPNFRTKPTKLNARVVDVVRYAPGQAAGGVQEIAGLGNQIDALFIPEQADGMVSVNAALGDQRRENANSRYRRLERRDGS